MKTSFPIDKISQICSLKKVVALITKKMVLKDINSFVLFFWHWGLDIGPSPYEATPPALFCEGFF
jgi:hypothetical protein